MTKPRGKQRVSKLTASQNIKILVIWSIFIGLLILLFRLVYKHLIKKVIVYVLSLTGHKTTLNNLNRTAENGTASEFNNKENSSEGDFENNKFKLSIGICYKNDINAVVNNEFIESLLKLSKITDLYLFVQVDNDENEKHIIEILERNGLFSNGLKRHRVLFCEKMETIPSFARQLQANMHMDTNNDNIAKLEYKVPNVAFIDFNSNSSFNECVQNIESLLCCK